MNLLPNTVSGTGSQHVVKLSPNQRIQSVQVEVVTTATVDIEVSNDPRVETDESNAVWSKLVQGVTADAAYPIDESWTYLRANVTAHTAGDVNAWVKLDNA